jgi:hypothetical protein
MIERVGIAIQQVADGQMVCQVRGHVHSAHGV